MSALWWSLTLVCMFVGLLGTFVPLLPGTTIIFGAAVAHRVMLGEANSVGYWTLGGLLALTLFSYVLDLVSGSLGARKFGATRWGAIGGFLGSIIGLFFFPWGFLLGPLLGVLVGELLGGRGLLPAGVSTWGSFLGSTVGLIAKVFIGACMICWFLIAALWR